MHILLLTLTTRLVKPYHACVRLDPTIRDHVAIYTGADPAGSRAAAFYRQLAHCVYSSTLSLVVLRQTTIDRQLGIRQAASRSDQCRGTGPRHLLAIFTNQMEHGDLLSH